MVRSLASLAVALSVLLACSFGLNNGLVLHFSDDGHLAVEMPGILHAHEHADGADHHPVEHTTDSDHDDLHHLVEKSASSSSNSQKLERSGSMVSAAQHSLHCSRLCLSNSGQVDDLAPSAHAAGGAANHRGGTAHVEYVCIRSTILIV
jgi:hypothetical protein